MTDLLIKPIPLPLPRPEMEEVVTGGTIAPRMPLEATEKAVDAFSGGGSYPTTGEVVKSLYGAVNAFKDYIIEMEKKMGFYGWLPSDWTAHDPLYGVIAFVVLCGVVIWWVLKK